MSGFCNSLLGKNIYEIKENDLINFFKNEQEETNTLEFKSGDVEIHKLCKEICAFLNTEGGLIIIGSPKEKKKKIGNDTFNICQGELTSSKFSNKDWLYKKIYSRITPLPTNLKIQEIKNEKSKYFVIEVNQSSNPPHQLDAEGRYYIRIEREAKPAPHGIVDAFFNRRQRPNPQIEIRFKFIIEKKDQILLAISNDSKITAEEINGYVLIYGIKNIIPFDKAYNNNISFSDGVYRIRLPDISYMLKGLSHNAIFEIEHFSYPYLISDHIWCKHSTLNAISTVYSPQDNAIIEEYNNSEFVKKEFSELKERIDFLHKDLKIDEPKSLILDCNYLEIKSKNNVGNIITINNAHTSNLKDYSEKYIQVILNDNSSSYFKCYVEKENVNAPKFYKKPKGSFIGQIQNEPEMYSFIISDVINNDP
jgi:hypothetical protein